MQRRAVRELITWGMLLVVLVLFGGVVWASYHPAHPWLRRAAGWPAVGPLVERFRAYYGVDERQAEMGGEAAGGEPAAEPAQGEAAPVPLGGPSAAAPAAPSGGESGGRTSSDAATQVWLSAGDTVRSRPDSAAAELGRQDVFERVAVLERDGDWVRVASRVGEGWVEMPEDRAAAYPLGSGVRPPRPLPSTRPDAEQLTAARELLGVDGPAGRLGPYPLYTDVRPASRLFDLDRVAAAVDPAYRQRYGRAPVGKPEEAILVFADESAYRVFQSREARLSGLPAGGHASAGLVAFWAGTRRHDELAATLVHELVHVLNRHALGPALPPWLDEGMADDLGGSAIGPAGELDPQRLGGAVVRRSGRLDYFGAIAALRNLNAAYARSEPPRLAELVDLSWDGFVRSPQRDLHYALAGFFIRYLVDGEDGALAPAFRRFLAAVADGGPATGEALRRELNRSWEVLDRGLGDFVREKVLESTPSREEERRKPPQTGLEPSDLPIGDPR